MKIVVTVLLAALVAAGCDKEEPTDPSPPPLNLSGVWRGGLTVQGQSAIMTWTLTQTNTTVTGPIDVGLANGIVLLNGALAGSVAGSTLTYTITVPTGGVPLQPACSGQIAGTAAVVSASTMNGDYKVASSTCSTGLTAGTFTMTK